MEKSTLYRWTVKADDGSVKTESDEFTFTTAASGVVVTPNPSDDDIHPLTDPTDTLIADLVPVVDFIRQLPTDLGVRPYRVFLVHTTWSGGARGKGTESVTSEVEILPTPDVSILEMTPAGITRSPTNHGIREEGSIVVSEITMTLDENILIGKGTDGTAISKAQSFYYEVREDGGVSATPRKRRFHPTSIPTRNPYDVGWSILCERAHSDAISSA